MEYQKINNLLGEGAGKIRKYNTINWIEINDQSNNVYNDNTAIKFNAPMLRTSLCDFSEAYIILKGKARVIANATGAGAAARDANQNGGNKSFVFKNCAPFTDCITKINSTMIENANNIDLAMPMYNLIEYSENYEKTSGSLWQFKRDELYANINDSESFKYKLKFTGETPNNIATKDVEIAVPLKYLSNFWRSLELSLIFCDVELRWKKNCILVDNIVGDTVDATITGGEFIIENAKLCIPAITLEKTTMLSF